MPRGVTLLIKATYQHAEDVYHNVSRSHSITIYRYIAASLHYSLLLHKQVHDKNALQNHCIYTYICRARLIACEVGVFLRNFVSRWIDWENNKHSLHMTMPLKIKIHFGKLALTVKHALNCYLLSEYIALATHFWLCTCFVPRLLCVGREKRACYTLFPHAQFPLSGNLEILINSTNLCEACRPLLCERCLPLTVYTLCGWWWGSDAGLSILAKYCSMWLTQSFPLKFTDRLEQSNADSYCQCNTVSEFKPTQKRLTGSNDSAVWPFSGYIEILV